MADITSIMELAPKSTQELFGYGQSADTKLKDDTATAAFDGIFNAAVNLVKGTNEYIQDAQRAEVAFAKGEITSTHELGVIERKASLSLQYTVAIKNQLLSAYRELMNMQF